MKRWFIATEQCQVKVKRLPGPGISAVIPGEPTNTFAVMVRGDVLNAEGPEEWLDEMERDNPLRVIARTEEEYEAYKEQQAREAVEHEASVRESVRESAKDELREVCGVFWFLLPRSVKDGLADCLAAAWDY